MHIYTDSAASISQISKTLDLPHKTEHCLNRPLLREIADRLWTRARNGLETHIHKVKAHTGACPGNDAADAAAVSVAKGTKQPTISEEASNESHMHHTWIGRIKSKGEKDEGTIHFASNLNKGLKDMLDPITSLGHCNKYSLYTRL
jgi:hypothetical protein